MEKAILFKNEKGITEVSQGQYDTPSHYSLFAMDLMGAYLTAPYKIKFVGKSNFGPSTQLYYQSVDDVETADGYKGKCWFYVDHSYDNPAVGTIYNQGSKFVNIGNKGLGSGAHAHIIGGKGTVNTNNLTFTSLGVGTNSGYTSYKPNCGTNSNFRDLYYNSAQIKYYYEAKQETFKTLSTKNSGGTMDFNMYETEKNGKKLYFYAENKDRNQADTAYINSKEMKCGTGISMYPNSVNGYRLMSIVNTTYFYEDVDMKKKYMVNNTHYSIAKGSVVLAVFKKTLK